MRVWIVNVATHGETPLDYSLLVHDVPDDEVGDGKRKVDDEEEEPTPG